MISKLKETREKAGYTIDDVADKLNIRKQYLIALEEEDYESIPGKIYIDGYTKIYYEFLGINLQIEQNDDLLPLSPAITSTDQDNNSNSSKYKKYILICSIILLLFVVILYNFLKSHDEIPFITSQPNNLDYGSEQETFDGSYKTD